MSNTVFIYYEQKKTCNIEFRITHRPPPPPPQLCLVTKVHVRSVILKIDNI